MCSIMVLLSILCPLFTSWCLRADLSSPLSRDLACFCCEVYGKIYVGEIGRSLAESVEEHVKPLERGGPEIGLMLKCYLNAREILRRES